MNSTVFDKTVYHAAKGEFIEMIRQSHNSETEGFIADGVICPNDYANEPLRILCILAETYGYDGCGITDIEEQVSRDILGLTNSKVKTTRSLSAMLWLIQESISQGRKVEWDEMPYLFKKDFADKLQQALRKIAWINLKKASRADGSRMVDEEISKHAKNNVGVLRKQIEATAPHLIIACSVVVFRELRELKLLEASVQAGRRGQLQGGQTAPWVVEVTHPSRWWSYRKVYDCFRGIYSELQSGIRDQSVGKAF